MYRKSWMACNRKNSSPDRSVVHGLSIVYVKDQMDHSSIQGTVQTYGRLIPGADVSFVDRLGENSKTNAHAEL
jgi:hypothetical protein